MTSLKKLFLSAFALLIAASLHAQLEVTHLFMKGESATGLGAFLHAGFPVSKGDEISGELAFDYFSPGTNHVVFVPLLIGYRHTFDGTGAGFYAEPVAGYSIGGTDIQKTDAAGNLLYNSDGSELDEKVNGPIVGLGFGYIIPNPRYPINFGVRYEHIFVSGDPSPNMLAFRVSWSVLTGRRLQGQQ
jgi:hypothetical protein